MTDYATLSDADLNAAIAVRVMGYRIVEAIGEEWFEDAQKGGFPFAAFELGSIWIYLDNSGNRNSVILGEFSANLNCCFAAQSALAEKGKAHLFEYVICLQLIVINDIPPVALFAEIMAPARTRCIAMLQACDAVEGESRA